MCALERASEAEHEILSICDAFPGMSRVERYAAGDDGSSRYVYELRARKMPAGFLQHAENDWAERTADRCGTIINERVETLERLPGACRRGTWFESFRFPGPAAKSWEEMDALSTTVKYENWGDHLTSERLGSFVYAVVDRRGQTATSATLGQLGR
jgi:hypothetical protein